MRKIKILNGSLLIFITLGIVGLVTNFAQMLFSKAAFEAINSKTGLGIFYFLTMDLLTFVFLFGLYQVQQSLKSFIENSFFNFKSAILLKKGGFLLIINGLLSSLNNLFSLNKPLESLISNYTMYFMLILIGIGLMAMSDIIARGTLIQEENDLTL